MSQFTCKCGSEYFVEQRVIKVAGKPSSHPRLHSNARSQYFRLVCAECGTIHGDNPDKPAHEQAKTNNPKAKK